MVGRGAGWVLTQTEDTAYGGEVNESVRVQVDMAEPKKVSRRSFEIEAGRCSRNTKAGAHVAVSARRRRSLGVHILAEKPNWSAEGASCTIRCRDAHAESGDHYDAGADRVGNVSVVVGGP